MGFVKRHHGTSSTETPKQPAMFPRLAMKILKACFLALIGVSAGALLVAFKYPDIFIQVGVYNHGTRTIPDNDTEHSNTPPTTIWTQTVTPSGSSVTTDHDRKQSDNVQSISPKPKPQLKVQTWNHPNDNPAFFKRREHKVTPLDFKFTIASDVCADGQTDLIILVLSMIPHRDFRNSIRETWGSFTHNNTWSGTSLSLVVRLVFIFGETGNVSENKDLLKEASENHDIVQANFKESYFNLTYKVLCGFQWVKNHCPGTKFIMKNDEDSFVHIPWLVERLQSTDWNSRIIGPYFTNEIRHASGKYGVSQQAYPFRVYPPHVKGNIYILPTNTAMQILEAAEYMPYVNMEDAHITGILAKVVGANHKAIPRNEYNPYGRPGVCDFAKRKKFAGNGVSAKYAKDIWVKLENPKLCK
ncbi:beta-1,3-galactosyltransferase 5-like isoform X2 [Haliotis rubra]|uniref:beta-1,3-galactosyltransferase 5-like isoform X2 n=1 Tax=Haliotis rubra TaxID=36100 RepID=UPI001EE53551|nr:beta-1,3-galactosyltransferase 5-like isoform X2 [Haliotis rubra]